jgi:hypothetical protein
MYNIYFVAGELVAAASMISLWHASFWRANVAISRCRRVLSKINNDATNAACILAAFQRMRRATHSNVAAIARGVNPSYRTDAVHARL